MVVNHMSHFPIHITDPHAWIGVTDPHTRPYRGQCGSDRRVEAVDRGSVFPWPSDTHKRIAILSHERRPRTRPPGEPYPDDGHDFVCPYKSNDRAPDPYSEGDRSPPNSDGDSETGGSRVCGPDPSKSRLVNRLNHKSPGEFAREWQATSWLTAQHEAHLRSSQGRAHQLNQGAS